MFWKTTPPGPGANIRPISPVSRKPAPEVPGFSFEQLKPPMVLYALEGTNTIDCRPIFIHDMTIQWEISPQYLEYCLDQMYDYDNSAHPEEEKLVHEVIRNHEMAFAWDKTERGHFREDYFEPVKIPVLAHTPWQERNIPIPPGIRDEVIEII
ncbi:hypothetical protein FB451DRAFT_1403572 [Mycena latifolia]|nr:hypothetical protein FB451DRAFT_1403572 [Mycena latifolia]